ncbi:MAG: electron transport complex subunit RsxC, partial [Psychrobium sp.]|nr:electron transport complex subunit RsxC [Psychrobium sp.]
DADEKKARVAAAIARAKEKRAAAKQSQDVPATDASAPDDSTSVTNTSNDSDADEKKARVAAAIARAKEKRAAAKQLQDLPLNDDSATDDSNKEDTTDTERPSAPAANDADEKKARIAAVIAKAKAKRLAQQNDNNSHS